MSDPNYEAAVRAHDANLQRVIEGFKVVISTASNVLRLLATFNAGGIAILKISNSDGGFTVLAHTAVTNASLLKPGDLVLWVAGKHLAELGEKMGDERKGWVGQIVAVLSPEMKMPNGGFRVSLDYRDLCI